jgi:hypothetical protein
MTPEERKLLLYRERRRAQKASAWQAEYEREKGKLVALREERDRLGQRLDLQQAHASFEASAAFISPTHQSLRDAMVDLERSYGPRYEWASDARRAATEKACRALRDELYARLARGAAVEHIRADLQKALQLLRAGGIGCDVWSD